MKKVLMNASVASMIYKFNMNNIDILETLGYQVDVACNFGKENPMNCEEVEKFKKILIDRGIKIIETNCPRSPFAFGKMMSTYKCLKKLADTGTYELVHTQSPIGGALCRLAFYKARKKGTRVIYTAHGFHFYKGAPLKNWLLYYSIEKICSYITDVLITINYEDYALAKEKMHAMDVKYVPGVGINLDKFNYVQVEKKKLRESLGIPQRAIWILSVGELSKQKNHEILIRALGNLDNVYCTIVGQGDLKGELITLIEHLGLKQRVRLLGFRTDISELCKSADIFAFPSLQEGLPVALMEAMASGLPVVCSRIRGNTDLIDEGKGGELFATNDQEEFEQAIGRLLMKNLKNVGSYNKQRIQRCNIRSIMNDMDDIYSGRGGRYKHLEKLWNRQCIRNELGITDTDVMLLSVGELNINKNHQVVIQAIAELKISGIHYVIVGRGELELELKALVKKLYCEENVHFLGYRTDVAKLYQAADIFVFPSYREGLPVALMEAMASGLPVVCSRIRGNIDLIDQYKGGVLFEPSQISDVKEALLYALHNDLNEYREYNFNKAQNYSKEKILREMHKIYQGVD